MNRIQKWIVTCATAVAAAGCAAHRPETAESPTLSGDQLVIGERIEFTGTDGKPVVPLPGLYRIGVEGDSVALYMGEAGVPLLLRAGKARLEPGTEQSAPPGHARAILLEGKEGSVARALWVCASDGSIHGARGRLAEVRTRGELAESAGDSLTTTDTSSTTTDPIRREVTTDLSGTSLVIDPRLTAWLASLPPPPSITAPAASFVLWNRLDPLTITWADSDSARVSLVHRASARVIHSGASTTGLKRFRVDHLDPGDYDVVVTDTESGRTDKRPIRVVGRPRTLAANRAVELITRFGVPTEPLRANGAHGAAIAPNRDTGVNELWQWGACIPQTTDPVLRPSALRRVAADIDAVAAGGAHWLAIRDGKVISWGHNWAGQLGHGHNKPVPPALMEVPADLGVVVEVAAGAEFSLALNREGRVFAWGANLEGQCGNLQGSPMSPVPVQRKSDGKPLENIVAIAAGDVHALALDRDGVIWGWGKNVDGALDRWLPNNEVHRRAVKLWSGFTAENRVRAVYAAGHTAFFYGDDYTLRTTPHARSCALVEEAYGTLACYVWGQDSADPVVTNFNVGTPCRASASTSFIAFRDSWVMRFPSGTQYSFAEQPVRVIAAGGAGTFMAVVAWETDALGPVPVLLTRGRNRYQELGTWNPAAFAWVEGWTRLYFN